MGVTVEMELRRFDVTDQADAAFFGGGGEGDVELRAAGFADGEVAGLEFHGGWLNVLIGSGNGKMGDRGCVAMLVFMYKHVMWGAELTT